MELDVQTIANEWLTSFGEAATKNDAAALSNLMLPNGWLRDVLIFTWDFRSLGGREKILHAYLAPRVLQVPQLNVSGVEFAFTFSCDRGPGRAYLVDLPGYEEVSTLPLRDDLTGIPGRDMEREFKEWVHQVETNPYVLIVGAGQTGLQIAARFKQMNLPSLVIDRHARVGDNWRKRYPSLTLHSPKGHASTLYQPYPTNWPEFTPRDKVADWLEQYSVTQDLVVWTSAELAPRPVYDSVSKQWDVTVIRGGQQVKLRPSHIVIATGTLGKPYVPDLPCADKFRGDTLHSTGYNGGAAFAGKRVVVVGAGNSSIDICQDLVLHDAESVTMIQRSATAVVSRDWASNYLRSSFPDDVPLPVSDFKAASFPMGLIKEVSKATQQADVWEANKEVHDKLRKAGVRIHLGDQGQGLHALGHMRLGGYWLDKGGADLIADGKIVVKSGVSPESFTEKGLAMSDGSELVADVVILATGFIKMREINVELLGEDVMSHVGEVFGLDDEGEDVGSFRPCGHTGLWFGAASDFFTTRFSSKALVRAVMLLCQCSFPPP
ncbi:FAD/NAD(P)-binding domain-containing protein [Cubamyces sp. BRFM 1775]|nr:FAD/NAD(P)-binding domain-containing protein [Cubamyces sp. BRFM 1775]